MTDDVVQVKQLIADGHDMCLETMHGRGEWKSVIRAAVYHGCVRSVEALLQAGVPLPFGFHLDPGEEPLGSYQSLLMVGYETDREGRMIRLLIEHGAWFSTRELSQFSDLAPKRYAFAYDYRAQLGACRLAQRALGRVLRGRVHRNVIPMIEAMVWSTRANERWLDACRQTK